MATWEQDFDFYMARIEGDPASFMLDLAAAKHAPVADHPLLLSVRVPMLIERPDGLRDGAELDALGVLEDQFCSALEQKVAAIYVGRVVHAGHTTMFFYVPEAFRAALADLPSLTGDPPGRYVPEWAVGDDPSWDHYISFMAPDRYAHQTIWNRRLLRQFTENGDVLDVPREIDHLAYFPDQPRAEGAAEGLRLAGFRIDPITPPTDGRGWAVQFHRDDALADGRPDEFVGEIFSVIIPLDGEYDGWGATNVLPT